MLFVRIARKNCLSGHTCIGVGAEDHSFLVSACFQKLDHVVQFVLSLVEKRCGHLLPTINECLEVVDENEVGAGSIQEFPVGA